MAQCVQQDRVQLRRTLAANDTQQPDACWGDLNYSRYTVLHAHAAPAPPKAHLGWEARAQQVQGRQRVIRQRQFHVGFHCKFVICICAVPPVAVRCGDGWGRSSSGRAGGSSRGCGSCCSKAGCQALPLGWRWRQPQRLGHGCWTGERVQRRSVKAAGGGSSGGGQERCRTRTGACRCALRFVTRHPHRAGSVTGAGGAAFDLGLGSERAAGSS